MNKRIEELERAEARLIALVGAAAAVAIDSTAHGLYGDADRFSPDNALDLEGRAVMALAHCKASLEVELRRANPLEYCRSCGTKLRDASTCRQCGLPNAEGMVA